jgi:hypothetical protein
MMGEKRRAATPCAERRTGISGDAASRVSTLGLGGSLAEFAFEGMFGTLTGLGEIGVGALGEWMRVAMRKLAVHGIVARLLTFVRLERTFTAVGIVFQMVGSVVRHGENSSQDGLEIVYVAASAYS